MSEALLPTQRQQPAQELPPARRAVSRRQLAIAGGTLLLALLLGFAIGRCTSSNAVPPPAPPSQIGLLAVVSKPADGNVMLDGRFVGVSPIDHLDLDPGMHTIVIDVFGYQPYAGTLEMEPAAKVKLSVLLAPVGAAGKTTTGTAVGGKATRVVVPPSALLPAGAGPSQAGSAAPPPKRASSSSYSPSSSSSSYSPPPPPPPERPRRDCSGEKSRCRDGCSRAVGDCNFNCPYCVTCLSTVGSEECARQCSTCKAGCDQNSKFCESSCDSQYSSCEASQ